MNSNEEPREEFQNIGFWIGDSIDKDLIPYEVMDKIADWWLDKITQAHQEERARLAGEIRKLAKLNGVMMQTTKDQGENWRNDTGILESDVLALLNPSGDKE